MKVNVLISEFAKTLSTSSRFVATRATLPILSNIVLKAQKSNLTVLATDLEISLSAQLGAQVIEEGEIAVPAKAFSEIIGNLAGEQVTLETEGETILISSEGFKSKVSGINTSEYPTILSTASKEALVLSPRVFVPSLTKVLFATSTDEARPVLTGVLFLFKKGEIVLISSDGFRLSQKTFPAEGAEEGSRIIVPRRVMSEIPRLAQAGDISFETKTEENLVVWGLPSLVLTSRVIEGEFPNFERIIPKLTRVSVNVSKEDLGRAVKLASIFARDNANTVKFTVKENELTISAESSKSGTEEHSIPAKVEGELLEVSFNYRFVEEFLSVVGGESVDLKLNDATSPSMFLDPKDPSFLHLIMPVRS